MRSSRRLKIGLATAAMAFALTGVALASTHIQVIAGKIVFNFTGGFSPTRLSKHTFTPITLYGSNDLSTTDGSEVPIPLSVDLEFDKNGKQNSKGLPVCQPGQLDSTTTAAAMAACHKALVGTGTGNADVLLPGQEDQPIKISSPILAFNGPMQGGARILLIHAYTTIPVPATVLIEVMITKIHDGRYGTEAQFTVPPIAGGYGHVTHADLTINKKYHLNGQYLGYAEAKCPDGHLQAKGTGTFSDGTVLSGEVVVPCVGTNK